MSTFTQNKGFEQPANGSYNNIWDIPVNADWAAIDASLGGTTNINVTGVAAGAYYLSLAQYRTPNIVITGVNNSGIIVYTLPAGVGGLWSVYNNTTGSGSVWFGAPADNYLMTQGVRYFFVSDGTSVGPADSSQAAAAAADATTKANAAQANAISTSESFATAAADGAAAYATANAAADATTKANAAQSSAISTASADATTKSNAAQAAAISTSETYANGTYGIGWEVLPNGHVHMWGYFPGQPSSPATITYPRPGGFPTVCESILITPSGNNSSYWASIPSASNTSFTLNFGASNNAFCWDAHGR
jgi:hypothetical protein